MTEYKPKEGSRLTVDQARRYGAHLEFLMLHNEAPLQARDVVADAKLDASPLHDYFDWNDSSAAESWREEQARYLLRNIQIEVETVSGEKCDVRFAYAVVGKQTHGYVSFPQVQQSEEYRQQVIEMALAELASWRKKYNTYAELFPVVEAIQHALPLVNA